MVVQAGVIFAKVAPAANARRAGVSPAMVVQALVISCQSRPRGECLDSRRLACVGCVGGGNFWPESPPQRMPGKQASSPASVVHALVFYCALGDYHRLRPRGRVNAALAWKAGVLACVGCAGGGFLRAEEITIACDGCAGVGNYHRLAFRRRGRLRSLQSKAPSAVARLRSVPFSGCQAGVRTEGSTQSVRVCA